VDARGRAETDPGADAVRRTRERPNARRSARLVIFLRWPVILLWLGLVVAAIVGLPTPRLDEGAGLRALVPPDSPALQTEISSIRRFGSPLLSRTVIVQRDPPLLGFGDTYTLTANVENGIIGGVDTLPPELQGVPPDAPFTLIGTSVVSSGSSVAKVWPSLSPNAGYEWYATVNDGAITTQGPSWRFTTSATVGVGSEMTSGIALAPIVPNPTHGRAHMNFALPHATQVRLSVLDIQGREVAVLAQGTYEAGRHSLQWDGHGAAGAVHAGLYLVRLQTPGRVDVQKMVWAR